MYTRSVIYHEVICGKILNWVYGKIQKSHLIPFSYLHVTPHTHILFADYSRSKFLANPPYLQIYFLKVKIC